MLQTPVTAMFQRVQCIPLSSLLFAVEYKHIDLLVLDVEGAEMDIFEHFNFDDFDIDVSFIFNKNHSKLFQNREQTC